MWSPRPWRGLLLRRLAWRADEICWRLEEHTHTLDAFFDSLFFSLLVFLHPPPSRHTHNPLHLSGRGRPTARRPTSRCLFVFAVVYFRLVGRKRPRRHTATTHGSRYPHTCVGFVFFLVRHAAQAPPPPKKHAANAHTGRETPPTRHDSTRPINQKKSARLTLLKQRTRRFLPLFFVARSI